MSRRAARLDAEDHLREVMGIERESRGALSRPARGAA
jgi:hypothetical protein